MVLYYYLVTFLVASFIGSFLNVLIDRIPRGESFLFGRSHCDNCRHRLAWYDLIPLLSYFILGGKCRYCRAEIPVSNFVVEWSTGALSVLLLWSLFGTTIESRLTDIPSILTAIYFFSILCSLIVIFFADLKYGIIPFQIVSFAIIFTFIWYFFFPGSHFLNGIVNHILSAIGTFVGFLLLFLVTRGRGLGFGDVVYVFLMGLLLGFPQIILGLYIAFVSGAIISLILVLMKKKKMKGGTIPFGPFLVMGTIISLLWGNFLIDKILSYLLYR